MGTIIGALAGGICFVLFGLIHAGHAGGLSMIFLLNKVKGAPTGQSPLIRIMVAAGIILGIVLGIALSMFLGGMVGGALERMLMEMAQHQGG